MEKLYAGDTFEVNGRQYRVDFEQDDTQGYPWDWSDGHGPVRQSSKPHRDGSSDKRPNERPLNIAGRNEYQFYYDWQQAIKDAKRDGWNTAPYDAPDRALRAVQADFDYLRNYIEGDWCYLVVTVTDVETEEYTCLGGVESLGDYASECAYDMAKELYHNHAVSNRFADAMELGV